MLVSFGVGQFDSDGLTIGHFCPRSFGLQVIFGVCRFGHGFGAVIFGTRSSLWGRVSLAPVFMAPVFIIAEEAYYIKQITEEINVEISKQYHTVKVTHLDYPISYFLYARH